MTDVSELNQLAVDLERAGQKAPAAMRPAVQVAAAEVKRRAQEFASGIGHAPAYPASITFETRYDGHGAEAEIGPDKDKPQGALGNILEYGTSKNAPITHLGPALDLAAPLFVKAVAEAGDPL